MRSSICAIGARQVVARSPARSLSSASSSFEPDHDLVAVVAQAHAVGAFVLLEVPAVAGQAVVARQHLAHVGVADAGGRLEVPGVARHRREPDERLQHVAVLLGSASGSGPKSLATGACRIRSAVMSAMRYTMACARAAR